MLDDERGSLELVQRYFGGGETAKQQLRDAGVDVDFGGQRHRIGVVQTAPATEQGARKIMETVARYLQNHSRQNGVWPPHPQTSITESSNREDTMDNYTSLIERAQRAINAHDSRRRLDETLHIGMQSLTDKIRKAVEGTEEVPFLEKIEDKTLRRVLDYIRDNGGPNQVNPEMVKGMLRDGYTGYGGFHIDITESRRLDEAQEWAVYTRIPPHPDVEVHERGLSKSRAERMADDLQDENPEWEVWASEYQEPPVKWKRADESRRRKRRGEELYSGGIDIDEEEFVDRVQRAIGEMGTVEEWGTPYKKPNGIGTEIYIRRKGRNFRIDADVTGGKPALALYDEKSGKIIGEDIPHGDTVRDIKASISQLFSRARTKGVIDESRRRR